MSVQATQITSHLLGRSYRLWTLMPQQPAADRLCLFLDGEFYLERIETCDHLLRLQSSGDIPPIRAVFVSHIDAAARHRDYSCNAEYTRFLVEEMLPWITRTHAVVTDDVLLAGLSLSGLAAAYAAIEHPEVFSRVLCQSPSAWWNDEWLSAHVRARNPSRSRFWISVGTEETEEDVHHEPTAMHQKSSQIDSCRRLAAAVRDRADAVHFSTFAGGHDMTCWNLEFPEAVRWLFSRCD